MKRLMSVAFEVRCGIPTDMTVKEAQQFLASLTGRVKTVADERGIRVSVTKPRVARDRSAQRR